MNVVNPKAELIIEKDPFRKIERVGRTCYKSESEFTDETSLKFFNMLKDRKHYGIFEHTRFIFEIDSRDYDFFNECYARPYFVCTEDIANGVSRLLVSANLRALNEGRLANYSYGAIPQFLELIAERFSPELDFAEVYDSINPTYPVKLYKDVDEIPNVTVYERRCHSEITVHFITDRGISHEFVRHREFSFAQESTRYCNYGLDKFGKQIAVINPFIGVEVDKLTFDAWGIACRTAESSYFHLLDEGVQPQNARSVLPTCLKTELIMTGTLNMWKHFFDLRMYELTGKAHPLAKFSATQAYQLMDERYAIKANYNI